MQRLYHCVTEARPLELRNRVQGGCDSEQYLLLAQKERLELSRFVDTPVRKVRRDDNGELVKV